MLSVASSCATIKIFVFRLPSSVKSSSCDIILTSFIVGACWFWYTVYSYTCDPADQILAMEHAKGTLFYADVQTGGRYPEGPHIYKKDGL